MNQNELYQAIRRTAWGYVLIHINFNLGTLNILPNWWGYVLFIMAIPVLGKEEESTNLLKSLGILLFWAEFWFWMNNCLIDGIFNSYLISVITSVISLYFHFQFLTNLANIARKYECDVENKILTLRTVQTILTTALFLISSWRTDFLFMKGLIVISAVVALWVCKVLFSFSRTINERMRDGEEVMLHD